MSTVVKIAGFGAFYRLMYGAFEYSIGMWSATIIAMVVLTLLIGNLIATRQHNFKRMLAYSSISHAGFMLMTILCVAGLHNGATANLLLYVVGYGAASIIAFTVLQMVHYKTGSDEMEAFNGLAKRNPFLAISLVIAMCSMAGIPLTAGFFGKFYMLSSIIEQGYLWLAIVAVLCSAISFYYYFMVIKAMYSKESETENIQINPSHLFVLIVCLAAIFVFGMAPFIIRGLLTV
jgi:NADH-quinone oxidoreductase subunit N